MAGQPKRRARKAAEAAARAEANGTGPATPNLPAVRALTSRDVVRLTRLGGMSGPRQIPHSRDMSDEELNEALRGFQANEPRENNQEKQDKSLKNKTNEPGAHEPIDAEFEPVAEEERLWTEPKKHRDPRGNKEKVLTEDEKNLMLDLLAENNSIQDVRDRTGITRRQLFKLKKSDPEFAEAYKEAKFDAADYSASQIVKLAQSALGLDAAGVQAVKLHIDALKWIASKLKPHEFGERVDMRLEAAVMHVSDEHLNAQIRMLLGVKSEATTAAANEPGTEEGD